MKCLQWQKKNHFDNIKDDFIAAMDQIPEQKDNAVAREIIAASIAQANALAAVKEVFMSY